jgi:hypothetical protein
MIQDRCDDGLISDHISIPTGSTVVKIIDDVFLQHGAVSFFQNGIFLDDSICPLIREAPGGDDPIAWGGQAGDGAEKNCSVTPKSTPLGASINI